jgi:hypothetical protein
VVLNNKQIPRHPHKARGQECPHAVHCVSKLLTWDQFHDLPGCANRIENDILQGNWRGQSQASLYRFNKRGNKQCIPPIHDSAFLRMSQLECLPIPSSLLALCRISNVPSPEWMEQDHPKAMILPQPAIAAIRVECRRMYSKNGKTIQPTCVMAIGKTMETMKNCRSRVMQA